MLVRRQEDNVKNTDLTEQINNATLFLQRLLNKKEKN